MKKKKYNKKEVDLSIDDITSKIVDLLYLENKVNFKKKNNIKLSKEEQMFDLFILPPSFLLRILERTKNEKI